MCMPGSLPEGPLWMSATRHGLLLLDVLYAQSSAPVLPSLALK